MGPWQSDFFREKKNKKEGQETREALFGKGVAIRERAKHVVLDGKSSVYSCEDQKHPSKKG